MTRWEYKYIDLYRGWDNSASAQAGYAAFKADVLKAGMDGWEAVGEVRITQNNIDIRVLMLKRPA